MKPIALTLEIAGKKRRFKAKKEVSIGIVLNSLELNDSLKDPQITPDNINQWLDFICSVYGYKFTKRDLQDNITYTDILPLTVEIIDYIIETAELQVPSENPTGEVVPFEKRKKS